MTNKLEDIYESVSLDVNHQFVSNQIAKTIERICRCERNKAPIRFLISGLLAKIDDLS